MLTAVRHAKRSPELSLAQLLTHAQSRCTTHAAESTIDYGDNSDIGDVFMDFDYSDNAADAAQGGGKSYAHLQEALYDIVDSGVTPDIAVAKLNSKGEAVLKSRQHHLGHFSEQKG